MGQETLTAKQEGSPATVPSHDVPGNEHANGHSDSEVNGHANGVVRDKELSQDVDMLQMLQTLKEIQAERASGFSSLQTSFQQLLKDHDEPMYRKDLETLTDHFQKCSSVVRQMIKQLKAHTEHQEWAGRLKSLQKLEHTKLQHTLILQALRKSGSENRFSWQIKPQEARLSSQPGTSNHQLHCCGPSPEPTEEDFNGAVKEATLELEAAVSGVNEIMEELQYLEADLKGSEA